MLTRSLFTFTALALFADTAIAQGIPTNLRLRSRGCWSASTPRRAFRYTSAESKAFKRMAVQIP